MLVLSGFRAMVIQMQCEVVVVVMCYGLRMRYGVSQVDKPVPLTPRRDPHQDLPQHGEHQKSGTGRSRHSKDSTDPRSTDGSLGFQLSPYSALVKAWHFFHSEYIAGRRVIRVDRQLWSTTIAARNQSESQAALPPGRNESGPV